MRKRRLVAGSAIVFTGIGLFRGLVQAGLTHASVLTGAGMVASAVAGAMVWVPITLVVALAWRQRMSRARLAAFHAVAGGASMVLEPFVLSATRLPLGMGYGPLGGFVVSRLDINALFYIAVAAATWAAERAHRQSASEVASADLERALTDAQLHVLTLQLHPHFLFNTLNLVSQLAYESVADALRTLANLRGLLVQSLEHASRREVALDDEIGFLNAYLEIQQTRFRDRLEVSVQVDRNALGAAIPHLLLQPLVENSIVHGIGPRSSGGRIDVTVRRRARGTGDRLVICIVDDGPGVALPVRDGLGLGNTRLRLQQLFGADYQLTIDRNGSSGTAVTVDIPFRLASAAQRTAPALDDEEAAHDDPVPRASRSRLIPAVQIIAAWTAVTAMWTELESINGNTALGPFVLRASVTSSAINAAVWIALTPLVVWLARRIDLGRRPTARAFAAHLSLGAIVAFAHLIGWLGVLYFVIHAEFHRHLYQSFDWLMWDFVAYLVMLALATAVSLSGRHRDVRLAMAANRARLARVEIASMRLRLQPSILLGGLDAIANAIAHDAARSEMAITRMGDLLRGLLHSADQEELPIADELSLLRAYLDVRGADERGDAATVCVDPRWPSTTEQTVPSLAIVSLAGIVDGAVESVHVALDDESVAVRMQTISGTVNPVRLAELDARLLAAGRGHRMEVIDRGEGLVLELILPLSGVPITGERPELMSA